MGLEGKEWWGQIFGFAHAELKLILNRLVSKVETKLVEIAKLVNLKTDQNWFGNLQF